MFLPFICYMDGMLSNEKAFLFNQIFGGHQSFGGVCSGFQSQGGSIHFCALLPLHNGFLRLISGVIPADFLVASMAAKLFSIHILAHRVWD